MPEKVYAVKMALCNVVQGNPATIAQKATNQKTVNSIVTEVIGTENHDLNTTQISTLQAIATQCPFECGDAVYEARSFYPHYHSYSTQPQ